MDFASLVEQQRSYFQTHATRALGFRLQQLGRLGAAIEEHEAGLLAALQADLRKPAQEAYASEIGMVLSEIREAMRALPRWARPQRARLPWIAWPGRARVVAEPYGVALIIGPWNYPFQLLFAPLVGALAAGNCAVLKASELAPRTAEVMAGLVAKSFAPEYVALVEGGVADAQELLAQRFDSIFFTGSTQTGRAVMAAAARHLTPVTLELGGKSPCIVCEGSDLEQAARRIAWGKFMNAGATCVAPDYLLVEKSIREKFIQVLRRTLVEFYGEDPKSSPDYGRIINRKHFERLIGYLGEGEILHGGTYCEEDLFVAPTILGNVSLKSRVMQEEIFGPILPLLEVGNLEEAMQLIARGPKPLALYLFSNDSKAQERVIAQTSSGGVCINDTVLQLLGKDLPFGGVGESGMGAYHGKASFECFSHRKSVLCKSTLLDAALRYPPFRHPLGRFKRLFPFLMR